MSGLWDQQQFRAIRHVADPARLPLVSLVSVIRTLIHYIGAALIIELTIKQNKTAVCHGILEHGKTKRTVQSVSIWTMIYFDSFGSPPPCWISILNKDCDLKMLTFSFMDVHIHTG